MPELCRFYGIVILMFFKDHSPPHIHAGYAEHKGRIEIKSGRVIDGDLPNRSVKLINEWISLNREELLKNWEECQKDKPRIKKIKPLE